MPGPTCAQGKVRGCVQGGGNVLSVACRLGKMMALSFTEELLICRLGNCPYFLVSVRVLLEEAQQRQVLVLQCRRPKMGSH